jgi:hypothetical protein
MYMHNLAYDYEPCILSILCRPLYDYIVITCFEKKKEFKEKYKH